MRMPVVLTFVCVCVCVCVCVKERTCKVKKYALLFGFYAGEDWEGLQGQGDKK